MKFAKTGVLLASVAVLVIVSFLVIGNNHEANATSVVGQYRSSLEQPTIVATTTTNGTPQPIGDYGDVELWVNPTMVPTAFQGTLVVQQSAAQSGPFVAVTPTIIAGSGTITYGTRTAPVVMQPAHNGLYTRYSISNTSAVSSGLQIRWIFRNTNQ